MKLKRNQTKRKLNRGEVCIGTMIRISSSSEVIPLCAAAGWDYVIVDMEHCEYDLETVTNMALLAKYEPLTFLVRIPDKHYHQIARTLDVGAEGLVVPRVEELAEVERIIESSKYYPLGSRGASVSTKATLHRPVSIGEYLDWSNAETLTVIQIESEEAVDRIDEILSCRGIDAVMIGPFDLSQSMGIPGELKHPRIAEAFKKVIDSCRRHGVAPGVHLNDKDEVVRWIGEGMQFITYQYDTRLLFEASREAVRQLKPDGVPQ